MQPDFYEGDKTHLSDIKAIHCQIAHLCFHTQDQQSCLKTKADRVLRAEHCIFTFFGLNNSVIREKFNHPIFSLQFLVCNFLTGNFYFWE